MSSIVAVDVADLSHNYGTQKALAGISFRVEQGETFGLLGPNGGGKTTLFRILSTLLRPTSGSASIFEWDIVRKPHEVRRRIGVVFRSHNLDRKLTAAENLHHQGHLYGMRGKALSQRIDELLERMELSDKKGQLVETFSGGQRRRVEIAKGLLHKPSLLLLDEPSAGLDPGARRVLWDYLIAIQRSDAVTILLTTHLLEEAERCNRLVILDRGTIVAAGTPEALRREVGGEVILLESPHPEQLQQELQKRFSVDATLLGGRLRFEHPRGHEFIPQLVETFPGKISSVMVAQPTLEDVFIRRTGRLFWEEKNANGSSG